jgi:hypothetical protein
VQTITKEASSIEQMIPSTREHDEMYVPINPDTIEGNAKALKQNTALSLSFHARFPQAQSPCLPRV